MDEKTYKHLMGSAWQARIQNQLRRGATRRDVLHGLTTAGLAAGLASGAFGTATRLFAQTPRSGGTLRVAGSISTTSDTADPALFSNSTDYSRGFMFYSGLTYLDSALNPQPQLAESWGRNDDASVWTFSLRPGVTFHDGSELTADDVVFSLMRHKIPETGSRASVIANQIDSAEATGPREVTVRLTGGNGDLPTLLATPHFMIIKDGTEDFTTYNGTGPFVVEEFTPGVRTIGVKNPNYFREGRPYLDRIEHFGISEENARLNALQSGDVQLTTTINPRAVAQLAGNPELELFETKGGTYSDLFMRKDTMPYGSQDFALGMKYLMNRELVKNSVFRDHSVIANDHPIDPTNPFYAADLPQRPFDPDKARFHFERAGVLGETLPMVVSEAARASIEIGTILQQDGADIGLNIELNRVPSDGYWSNYWLKAPFAYGTLSARPTADLMLSLLYHSEAPWNEAAWHNEKFDQLLIAARTEADPDKRKQMYADMQYLIHEEGGTMIPVFFSNLDANHVSVKGLEPVPAGNLMGYNFAEFVWLDA